MGRWDNSFFDDDLALDVLTDFDTQVENGTDPSIAASQILKTASANEILNEFSEDERDELFWEESSGLIFAAAVIQLEHNALQPETKKLALQAIAAERESGADERTSMLADLEKQLKGRLLSVLPHQYAEFDSIKDLAETKAILEQESDMQVAVVRVCADRLGAIPDTLGKHSGKNDIVYLNLYHQDCFPWESRLIVPVLLRRKLPWKSDDIVFIVKRISDVGFISTFVMPFLPQLVRVITKHVDANGMTSELKKELRRMKKALGYVERAAEVKLMNCLSELIARKVS